LKSMEQDVKTETTVPQPIPRGPERGPSSSLPPTARNILDAAKRLLDEQGYTGLRFDALAAASGSNKSMIRYYFGSKAGLVAALVDDLTHDATLELLSMANQAASCDERVRAHLAGAKRLMQNPSFRSLFDILPHALREPGLRAPLARLYTWYREVNVRCFGGHDTPLDDPRLLALGSVFMAAIDGLAIQVALEEPEFDKERAWAALEQMVTWYVSCRPDLGDSHETGP
jgi:AcrR family transcriptional regulator